MNKQDMEKGKQVSISMKQTMILSFERRYKMKRISNWLIVLTPIVILSTFYIAVYFTEDKLTHEFESLLNIRIETMLKNREMPDLLEKVEELRKQKAERNYEKKENS